MYGAYIEEVITPEGSTRPHTWLLFHRPFPMGPRSKELVDLGVEVHMNGVNCPQTDFFAAVFHESKPHMKSTWNSHTHVYDADPFIFIESARNEAGEQVVSRLQNRRHNAVAARMGWVDIIGSLGMGPYWCMMARSSEDGNIYRIYEDGEEGNVAFRREVVAPVPFVGYKFPINYFEHVDTPTFRRMYTAAGTHALEQLPPE